MIKFPKPSKVKRWNTKRKISKETKEIINERDKVCIISWWPIEVYHHCFFGLSQNLWLNRNDPDQIVWLSADIHHKLHFEWGNNYRQEAIDYITNYYGKIPS